MEVTTLAPPRAERPVRRAGDVLGAALLLALSLPVLAAASLVVLLGSGRPLLFGHTRVGHGGRPFRCWKLRTMVVDAEHRLTEEPDLRRRYVANGFKIPDEDDPRVTPVGRWLRRRHLDELPQLFNVLNGTMSLVGPRPLVAEELVWYGDAVDELLAAKPGIVGAWTSMGHARPDYPDRAHVELSYVRSRTARGDLEILARSVGVVLRGRREG